MQLERDERRKEGRKEGRNDCLIEWCFTPLSTVFQLYHGDSSYYSCLSWVSPVLGRGSEVSSPRTLPGKNPEDPVRLEPRTPGLLVKHFTTEPRGTRTKELINEGRKNKRRNEGTKHGRK